MSIVTKQGDQGKTKLLSGEEVSKADISIEAIGALDELVTYLGLARASIKDKTITKEIRKLQIDLFRLGAEIGVIKPEKYPWVECTNSRHILWLESRINKLEEEMDLPKSFIVPGATKQSAMIDIARAAARRLERRIACMAEQGEYDNPNGMIYINRLSDYLFLLARQIEKMQSIGFDAK